MTLLLYYLIYVKLQFFTIIFIISSLVIVPCDREGNKIKFKIFSHMMASVNITFVQ